jgi:hypothetical protein
MSRTAHGTPSHPVSSPGPAPPGTDLRATRRHQGGRGRPAAPDRRADRRPMRGHQQPTGQAPPGPTRPAGPVRRLTGAAPTRQPRARGAAPLRHRPDPTGALPGRAGVRPVARSGGGGSAGRCPGWCRGAARDAPRQERVGPGQGRETGQGADPKALPGATHGGPNGTRDNVHAREVWPPRGARCGRARPPCRRRGRRHKRVPVAVGGAGRAVPARPRPRVQAPTRRGRVWVSPHVGHRPHPTPAEGTPGGGRLPDPDRRAARGRRPVPAWDQARRPRGPGSPDRGPGGRPDHGPARRPVRDGSPKPRGQGGSGASNTVDCRPGNSHGSAPALYHTAKPQVRPCVRGWRVPRHPPEGDPPGTVDEETRPSRPARPDPILPAPGTPPGPGPGPCRDGTVPGPVRTRTGPTPNTRRPSPPGASAGDSETGPWAAGPQAARERGRRPGPPSAAGGPGSPGPVGADPGPQRRPYGASGACAVRAGLGPPSGSGATVLSGPAGRRDRRPCRPRRAGRPGWRRPRRPGRPRRRCRRGRGWGPR